MEQAWNSGRQEKRNPAISRGVSSNVAERTGLHRSPTDRCQPTPVVVTARASIDESKPVRVGLDGFVEQAWNTRGRVPPRSATLIVAAVRGARERARVRR